MPAPTLVLRVISLKDSAERRAAVEDNLRGFSLPWAFLDACRAGDESGLAEDPDAQRHHFGRALTPGETGCFKSHMKALAEFDADPALDWLLVIEDDVWLDPAFPYGELAGWLEDKGIGFLRLFAREWRHAYPRYRFGERQILFLASDPYGTQGYMISREAAGRFRAHVTAILRPIDDEIGRYWANGLDNHLLFPFPLVERHMTSTMGAARDASVEERPPQSVARLRRKAADFVAKRAYLSWRVSLLARDRVRPRKR